MTGKPTLADLIARRGSASFDELRARILEHYPNVRVGDVIDELERQAVRHTAEAQALLRNCQRPVVLEQDHPMSATAALRADALQQLAQAEVLDPADAELVALSVAQLEAMDPEVLGERLQALGQEALNAMLDALDNEQAVIALEALEAVEADVGFFGLLVAVEIPVPEPLTALEADLATSPGVTGDDR